MTKAKQTKLFYPALILVLLFFSIKGINYYFNLRSYIYPDFGVDIPAGYTNIGIDVSHYQGKINWKELNEMRDNSRRITFVFIKATQRNNIVDRQFKRNWKEAKKYGIKRGAYLYFDASVSGLDQADYFIEKVRLDSNDFPPVIDIEELFETKAEICNQRALACAKKLEQHYGVRPIIYSSSNFYTSYLARSFSTYPLWIAHYTKQDKPRINRAWDIWQFSAKGRANGIGGEVDFNVMPKEQAKVHHLSQP